MALYKIRANAEEDEEEEEEESRSYWSGFTGSMTHFQ
jgi:hypothetical protein